MDSKHSVLFQVSLSNGETFYEEKGKFVTVPGELSPWNKLLKYISENKVLITSLSLYTKDGRTFNLPSAGRDPKFRPFVVAEKPIDFCLKRYLGREMDIENLKVVKIGPSDWFTSIEAVYPNYKLQIWVDENNTQNSWSLVLVNK